MDFIASYFCSCGSQPREVKILRNRFKRPKIHEDSFDFDDFWTELIALAWAIVSILFFVRRWAPIAKNFEKF